MSGMSYLAANCSELTRLSAKGRTKIDQDANQIQLGFSINPITRPTDRDNRFSMTSGIEVFVLAN